METPFRKTHPMILVAATSLTIASLAGLASVAGWIPGSHNATIAPVAQEKVATLNIPALMVVTPV